MLLGDRPGAKSTPVGLSRRTTGGVVVNEDSALNFSAVYCATRVIAETFATLPCFLYKRTRGDDREFADNHPLYSLIRHAPNPTMSGMAFRESRTALQVNWGNAFAEIERGLNDEVVGLWPIHSSRVTPVPAGQLYADGYRYLVRNDNGSRVPLYPSEMLHVPGVCPDDGIWAKGVIQYARESIGGALAVEAHGSSYFGGGAQPKGVLVGLGLKDKEARKAFREEWKEIHGSPDSSEVAILPVNADYKPVSIPNNDSQFLETRKHNITEIARWYRLPPHMIMDLEHATFSNIEHQGVEFVVYSMLPWVRRWEEQQMLKLLRPKEQKKYYIEYNLSGLMRGDTQARFTAYAQALANGIMTLNEIRRLENLNGIGEAGDQNFIQLNMTTVQRLVDGSMEESAAKPQAPQMATQVTPADTESSLLQILERMAAVEENAVKRKIDSPDFLDWLADWASQHSRRVADSLQPIRQLLLAANLSPHGVALQVVQASARILRQAYETSTKPAMAALLEQWRVTRPREDVQALLKASSGNVCGEQ
jgi:HK97 family phage portal protein